MSPLRSAYDFLAGLLRCRRVRKADGERCLRALGHRQNHLYRRKAK